MTKFRRPAGTHDLLPEKMANRNFVESVICQTFEEYGFQPIQTPLFEEFALLSAQSGEEIRQKMFTFTGSDRVDYALRPELTAPVCRVIADGQLQDIPYPYKFYYVGQCVRQEPLGQDREFRQLGVELIGASSVSADAEIITIPVRILDKLNISAYELKIGDTGIFREIFNAVEIDPKDLSEIIGDIDHLTQLREECEFLQTQPSVTSHEVEYIREELSDIRRLQGREFRGKYKIDLPMIKQLEDSSAKEWLEKLPLAAEEVYKMTWKERGHLSDEISQLCINISKIRGSKEEVMNKWEGLSKETAVQAKRDLLNLCSWLDDYGVTNYEIDLGITRGFDFYTGMVFEIESPLLETHHQICGGGRYDRLVKELGGQDLPGAGFAFQFERLMEVFQKSQVPPIEPKRDCYVATTVSELMPKVLELAETLRREGKKVEVDLMGRNLQSQLDYAAKANYDYAVILAPDKLQEEVVILLELKTQKEQIVAIDELKDRFGQ